MKIFIFIRLRLRVELIIHRACVTPLEYPYADIRIMTICLR